MPKRLQVIDGADKGQSYQLPEAGAVLIGNSRKHTDICLHDLFVARVHCQVDVEGDRVTVSDRVTPNGILVNGAKVPQRDLQAGDVIRIGNSYLRLEEFSETQGEALLNDQPAPTSTEEPAKLPNLPFERLGELVGHTLAHFKLGAAIAAGHSGIVFRARDLKSKEYVALKVFSPEFPASFEEMQQFIEAMKPRLALRHPSLATLCGAGKAGSYVWIATEFIEGESLSPAIERLRTLRKIPWRSAFDLALQLSEALEYLRQHHLVHGNIVPANILQPVGEGPARLNDVGVCDALAGSKLQQQIKNGKLNAELPFVSPEHLDDEIPVDDLSDQYCLGAILYSLLTGRAPFEGNTPEQLMERIRHATPVKPKEYQPGIPDSLQAIVLRMLAKHPEERYPSPEAMLADLAEGGVGSRERARE